MSGMTMNAGGTGDLDRIEDAVAAVRDGELVVVVDDTDRENEGDLIMAASPATTERMAFMIRHTSGIICAPMGHQRAERLHLPPMVANNLDPLRTAFTVTVDYREGMTTGISASERASTVRALARADAEAADFLRLGHVFPLIAREGGVLTRSGHTEAAVDLATMAGLPDVAVLAEVVNDDGTVKRFPELVSFAREHGLRIISIEDLIAHRLRSHRLVRRVRQESRSLEGGTATVHVYATAGTEQWEHVAIVFGDLGDGTGVPCRIRHEDPVESLLGSDRAVWDVPFGRFKADGRGVFILLRSAKLRHHGGGRETQAPHADGEGHTSAQARKDRWLEIGAGAQILRDIGVRSIKLISGQERLYVGLPGYGIDIEERIAV